MEEIKIYRSIWDFSDWRLNKGLFLVSALLILSIMHFTVIDDRQVPWWLVFVCILGISFLLCIVINMIRARRPYLIIGKDGIVVNAKRGQWTVRFDEVKSFECEVARIWRFTTRTDEIIVHLKNGNGYVKMFAADGLTMKAQELCDILNERLKNVK